MSVFKITDNIFSVGVLNPNLRVFDIVMKTEYGTSYNSYIVKGEKTALIETCHKSFFNEYIDNIAQVCPLDSIDYIILNHTEPDHSGALEELSKLCPRSEIIASRAASVYLKAITNNENLNVRAAADNDTLDLGGGKVLRFINAPFLHWPDSMFTWLESDNALFSCDFFGSHYCEPRMLDRHVTYLNEYKYALKNYYDAIFGPFPTFVQNGLNKIKDLNIKYVCNSHGPVLTGDGLFPYVKDQYESWSKPAKNEKPLIPIFYCSAYGNTKKAAEVMRDAIASVISDAEINLYNIIEHDMSVLAGILNSSDAFLIGTPTLNRDALPPVWQLLSHIDAINIQKKPCAVFGTYGWSGEAVGFVCKRLSDLKLKVFGDGIKFNFVPGGKDLEACGDFALEFAKTLFK